MRIVPAYRDFISFLREYQGIVILSMHSQSDPDAVGSAIALTQLINVINPNLLVYTLEPELSALGQKVLDITDFEFNIIKIDQLTPPLLCILIDTNSINPILVHPENHIAIFDHHICTSKEIEIVFDFQLENFRATAEIVASLYHHINYFPTPKSIKALLTGILFDTRRFLYADRELFDCINFLLRDNSNTYSEALGLFSSMRSYPEKLACIKSAQRMKRYLLDDKILLLSHVSSFEASAARSLIFLGGDIAIVIANRKEETRISFRTTSDFFLDTGVSLGKDIIPPLIKQFGGTGGGHNSAAGYNTSLLDIKTVKEYLFQLFEEKLRKEK